jgi:hypothetical protein
VAGQPDPQRAGPALEHQRGVHEQRLAVQADLDRGARADLEPRRAPLLPAGKAADLAGGLQGHEHPGLGGVTDPGRDDPQHAVVQPLPRAPAGQVIELVRIVRDQDELGRRDLGAVRPGEPQVERGRVPAEQVGQHRRRRPQLRVAVLRRLDHLRVQAERGIVHEHPAVDRGQVDRGLDPVGERLERAHHVIAVQAQVECEVIPGSGGHAHVRHAPAAGHGRHQRLRAVAPGHADHVGAARDRVVGQLEQVIPGLEHDRLDAPPLALLRQPVALGLAAPRLHVHDQHGVPRSSGVAQRAGPRAQLAPDLAQRVAGRRHRHRGRDHQPDHVHQAEVLQ